MAVTSEAASARKSATAAAASRKSGNGTRTNGDGNGTRKNGNALPASLATDDLALILASLQTMRKGDFSVRLPVAWTGIQGKIADTFNDIVAANEQMAAELTPRRPSRRQGRPHPRTHAL